MKDKEVPDKISFTLKTDNLTWENTENGRIKFFSKKKDRLLFYLEPVSAVDSKGAVCGAVSQNITEKGDNLQIDILIDKNSLTDEQYPVTIDPTVTIIPDYWAAMDTYIEKPYYENEDNFKGSEGRIFVGKYTKTDRGLIKFDLSSLPKGTIKSAYLLYTARGPLNVR